MTYTTNLRGTDSRRRGSAIFGQEFLDRPLMPYPIPSDESKRLAALQRYEILDTPSEVAFDRITTLAAELLGVPAVLVSLVDDARQWFKSNIGIGAPETPRDVAFCAHTIMANTTMVVPDATRDGRFANNPLVTGAPHIRFYAGAPIRTPDGFNLGTLCAIDFEPKQFTPGQISILEKLAAIVIDEIELRLARLKAMRQVADSKKAAVLATRARAEAEIWLEEAIESIADGFALFDGKDCLITSNRIYREMHSRTGCQIASGMSYEDILRNAALGGCFANAADDVDEWVRGRLRERRRGAAPAEQPMTDGRWLWSADYRTNSGATVTLLTDITELKKRETALRETTEKLQVITKAMTAYIENSDWKAASASLLHGALQLLESRYGFIGVLAPGPVLRVLNHEGMEWHKTENRGFYEQALANYQKHGYLEFTNFNNLFGRVITTGEPVISNDPHIDGRSGGIPPGHPPLDAFLGVPLLLGSEIIGMIGIANRPGGYGSRQQERLQVLAQFAAVLYDNFRQIERHQKLEAELHHADKIQAVGQLTGGVAHDFNNLLTVILGQLELLEDSNELNSDRPKFGRGGDPGGPARRGVDASATRLLAQAGFDSGGDGYQRINFRHDRNSEADTRRRDLDRNRSGDESVAGYGRPESGRERVAQSRDQRPRRHAEGGQARRRDREHVLRQSDRVRIRR